MATQESLVSSEVFRIEELVLYVFKAFDKNRDRLSLALTCSYLFRLLMPQLWEKVHGIERLFALVPGASLEKDDVWTDLFSNPCLQLTIVIPQPPQHNDLLRFHMYCSFVKHLVLIEPDTTLDLRNGDAISSLADPRRILFPNLLSLSLGTVAGYDGQRMRWLSDLLSPCLQSFQLAISGDLGPPSVTPEDHNAVLDALAQRCPQLRELDLTIYPRELDLPNETDTNLRMWLERPFHISRMTALRSLSVGALYVRAGGLEVFGTLPLLGTLKLSLASLPQPEVIPDTLPEDSYPSLLHLSLCPTHCPRALVRVWKLLARTRKLISFEVDYCLPYIRQAQRDIVSLVIRGQCPLENLTLHQSIRRALRDTEVEAILTVEPLSVLPLRTLRISTVEKAPLDVIRLMRELRQTVFPSLHTFSILGILLTFEMLAAFARSMPRLERLDAQIDFSSVATIPPTVECASSVFRTLTIDIWDERAEVAETSIHAGLLGSGNDEKIVRFLSALWPNIQIKVDTKWASLGEKHKLEMEQASQAAEILNQGIAVLAHPSS